MSLSSLCIKQQEREQARLRKLLLWGVLGSVGMHAIAFSLSAGGPWPQTAQAELAPIELLVMEPPPESPEEQTAVAPAELSQQTNESVPAAIARAHSETAVAAPSPPPPAELVEPEPAPEPEPESIPETAVKPELTAPEETEAPEETAQAEAATPESAAPPEAVAVAPPALTDSQLERLRNFLERTGKPDPHATGTDAAVTAGTATEAPGTIAAPETAARTGGTENSTQPSGDDGGGQGSRTVACQNCALPQYPDSALDAGVEGTPRVQVEINPDGTVRSVTLVQSSGNAAIDQAAMQAARSSSFQPIAGGASVPIEYDLTIEGSRRHREAQQRGDRRAVEVPDAATETPSTTTREAEPASGETALPTPAREADSSVGQDVEATETPPATAAPGNAAPSNDDDEAPAATETAPPEPIPASEPAPPTTPAPAAATPELTPTPEPVPAAASEPAPETEPEAASEDE